MPKPNVHSLSPVPGGPGSGWLHSSGNASRCQEPDACFVAKVIVGYSRRMRSKRSRGSAVRPAFASIWTALSEEVPTTMR